MVHPSKDSTDELIDKSMHEAVSAIAAVGVSPIVRIPDMQSWMIKRKLAGKCSNRHMLISHQAHSTVALME